MSFADTVFSVSIVVMLCYCELFNDTSLLQTESGDYLLLSPGGQSFAAADFDQGVIIEEEEGMCP